MSRVALGRPDLDDFILELKQGLKEINHQLEIQGDMTEKTWCCISDTVNILDHLAAFVRIMESINDNNLY